MMVYCICIKAFSKDKEQLFADLKLVGTKFWIAMPFKFGHNTSILASKNIIQQQI